MRDAIDGTAATSAAFKDYRSSKQGFRVARAAVALALTIKICFANMQKTPPRVSIDWISAKGDGVITRRAPGAECQGEFAS